jgi:CheY-like chemotaxis protein
MVIRIVPYNKMNKSLHLLLVEPSEEERRSADSQLAKLTTSFDIVITIDEGLEKMTASAYRFNAVLVDISAANDNEKQKPLSHQLLECLEAYHPFALTPGISIFFMGDDPDFRGNWMIGADHAKTHNSFKLEYIGDIRLREDAEHHQKDWRLIISTLRHIVG